MKYWICTNDNKLYRGMTYLYKVDKDIITFIGSWDDQNIWKKAYAKESTALKRHLVAFPNDKKIEFDSLEEVIEKYFEKLI